MERLASVHAELAPLGEDERCEVCVTAEHASGEERLILDVLEATERWLVDHGFPGTKVTAEGKTYTLERPSR